MKTSKTFLKKLVENKEEKFIISLIEEEYDSNKILELLLEKE